MKKVGRNVYGSGDTIVTKTSHFFQGLTLGAEGGGLVRGTLRYIYLPHTGKWLYMHMVAPCTTLQKQKGHHKNKKDTTYQCEANTQALQKVFGVAFRTEEDDAMVYS